MQAFAGIGAGDDAPVGLSLGDVNFGLALISDPDHPERNFVTLQATAASAAVQGISGLTLRVQDLLVNVNRGITLAAEAEQNEQTNTRLGLTVPMGFLGTLVFGDGSDSADLNLVKGMTNAELLLALTAAVGSLSSVGAGNVRVTGNRDGGFELEFIGTLAGTAVSGITVQASAAAVTVTVDESTAADAGQDEIKRINIQALRDTPAPVSANVSTVVAGQDLPAQQPRQMERHVPEAVEAAPDITKEAMELLEMEDLV